MATITINLTDTELKCLEYSFVSPEEWLDNWATSKAEIAKSEILSKLIQHCNTNQISLEVGVDAQINQAFELGIVDTASNVQQESLAALQNG
jgi:hypothetical protein